MIYRIYYWSSRIKNIVNVRLQRSAFVMAASVVAILVGATTFALYMYNLFTYVHLMDGNCQANYPNIIDLCTVKYNAA